MGCGEGELEKKTRKGFSNGLLAGVMGAAAGLVLGGVPLGFYAMSEGEDIGYEAGKKAGVAEAQAEAPKMKVISPVFDEQVNNVHISGEQNKGGVRTIYELSIAPDPDFIKEGNLISQVIDVDEAVYVTHDENTTLYLDFEGEYITPDERICRGKHDGIVDYIGFQQLDFAICRNFSQGGYEDNKAVFDEADALLKQTREQFSVFGQ